MKRFKVIAILLAFCVIAAQKAFSQYAASDTAEVFVINDSTELYWAEEYTSDFMYMSGFHLDDSTERTILHQRMVNGANDTTYLNSQIGNLVQSESLRRDDESYFLSQVNLSDDDLNNFHYRKRFDYSNQIWEIVNFYDDWSYYSGRAYDPKRTVFYSLSEDENYSEDKNMLKLLFLIWVIAAFCIIFPMPKDRPFVIVWLIICAVIGICSVAFLDLNVINQLFLPLMCLCATALLFMIPRYSGTIRRIGQLILGIIIILFFALKQYVFIDSSITLSDGYELNIKWKRGTCLIKRAYIRNILSNLIPVKVNSNDEEYTLYVSKYEFSSGNAGVVSDEVLMWLFGSSKDPLYNFSFRESQVMLEYLNILTGVKFDFLTYGEWCSISKGKKHAPNNIDYCKVNKGDVSEEGLVNILGNMPEFTSSYYPDNYRLSLAADTMFRAYNYVAVAGSAFECSDSLNVSIVNKNVRNGLAGFRLVFRPDDIGARKFNIQGFLRSDKAYTGLPERIELLSVDGRHVKDLYNYESFEELLIEGRMKDRRFEAVDLSDNKVFDYNQPEGLEYYDFEPVFTFVSL